MPRVDQCLLCSGVPSNVRVINDAVRVIDNRERAVVERWRKGRLTFGTIVVYLQVERVFWPAHGAPHSTRHIRERPRTQVSIRDYLAYYNEDRKPFTRTCKWREHFRTA
jgi:hypothetical protein